MDGWIKKGYPDKDLPVAAALVKSKTGTIFPRIMSFKLETQRWVDCYGSVYFTTDILYYYPLPDYPINTVYKTPLSRAKE